jgi:hypothetical protein
MREQTITWKEFKLLVGDHIAAKRGPRMCRGQSNSSWSLVTSFHRKRNGLTLATYFSLLPDLADWIGSIEARHIEVADPEIRGSFLAYLQHNGFPTPLLDWTLSPYIAAYFAFSEINDIEPQTDDVSIFVFDHPSWVSSWKQTYDYFVADPHVTILKPKAMGNLRQLNQQGLLYTFTNVDDIQQHITLHEKAKRQIYLSKYRLSVKERPIAMVELEAMGINAFTLFGKADGICRWFKEAVFRSDQVGKGPTERLSEFLKKFEKPILPLS